MPIQNIIFDFGGVICDIDISLTEKAFLGLGMKGFDRGYSVTERDNFFRSFETGAISPEQFRATLRTFMDHPVTDAQIDEAWNALLLDMPDRRIELLKKLRNHYRLFLLSNTNPIHYASYLRDLQEKHSIKDFQDIFEKAWFSHQIKLRKPFREVFEFVLRDAGLKAAETLFIDDSIQHVEGARQTGLFAYHLLPGEDINDLFNPEMQFLRSL